MQVIAELLGISHPAAVRRPNRIQDLEGTGVGVGVHVLRHGRCLVEVQIPHFEPFVGVGELPRIRGPPGRIIKGGRIAQGNFPHFARPALIADVEGVFARLIGQVSDRLAIRRPGWVPLDHGRSSGQIANIAFFGRHGEDLAAGGKDRPGAGRGEGGGLDLLGLDLLEVGSDFRQIARNADVQRLAAAGTEVEQAQRTELFIDDGPGPCRGRFNVQAVIGDDLRDVFGVGVVGKERDRAVAVGEEVDGVANPQGIEVVGIVPWNLRLETGVGEVGNPDRARLSAPVPLPRLLPLHVGNISQAGAIRRKGPLGSAWQRNFGRKCAVDGNGEEPWRRACETRPLGAEEDLLAVGCPAQGVVGTGVIGHAPGHAARGGDQIDIRVAVVLARECDQRVIRGE